MKILKLNELLSTEEKRINVGQFIVDIIAQDCNEEIIKKNCQVKACSDGSVMVSISNNGVPSFRKFKTFETCIREDGSIISRFNGPNGPTRTKGVTYVPNCMQLISDPESGLSSIYINVSGKYVCNYIFNIVKMLKCELNDTDHIRITDDGMIDDIRYILKDRSFCAELTERLYRKSCVSVMVDATNIYVMDSVRLAILSLTFNKKSPEIRIRANDVNDVKRIIALIDYICDFCHSSATWVREHEKNINRYRKSPLFCYMITEQLAKSVFRNKSFSQKMIINDDDGNYYKGAMFHSVQPWSENTIVDITTTLSSQSIDMNVVSGSAFDQLKISGTMSKAKIVTTNGYELINRQLQALDNCMEMPSEHSHPLPSLQNINRMLKDKHSREKIAEYAKTLFDTDDVRVTDNSLRVLIMNPEKRRGSFKNSLLIRSLSETVAVLEWNIHGRIKNMNLWRLFDKINREEN